MTELEAREVLSLGLGHPAANFHHQRYNSSPQYVPCGGQGGRHADEVGVADEALLADAGAAQRITPVQLESIGI